MTNRLITPKKKTQLVTTKRKAVPASMVAQKAWGGLSKLVKKDLRKSLPDNDKDGVPNGFDCRPNNKRRQEPFLPADEEFLYNNREIKPRKKINNGFFGDVFTVKGNNNLVIKIPRYFINTGNNTTEVRKTWIGGKQHGIETEAEQYEKYELNNEPLFTPTKVVNIGKGDLQDRDNIGLVRPKVTPVYDNSGTVKLRTKRRMTDKMLKDLRIKLIDLSYKGFSLEDGLQIGIDKANRLLIYDSGHVRRYSPSMNIPFETNNHAWKDFVCTLSDDWEVTEATFDRIGFIEKGG